MPNTNSVRKSRPRPVRPNASRKRVSKKEATPNILPNKEVVSGAKKSRALALTARFRNAFMQSIAPKPPRPAPVRRSRKVKPPAEVQPDNPIHQLLVNVGLETPPSEKESSVPVKPRRPAPARKPRSKVAFTTLEDQIKRSVSLNNAGPARVPERSLTLNQVAFPPALNIKEEMRKAQEQSNFFKTLIQKRKAASKAAKSKSAKGKAI